MDRAQEGMWSTLGGAEDDGSPGMPPFLFGRSGLALVVLISVLDGDSGGYTHIAHIDISAATSSGYSGPRTITMGRFEVTKLVSWDDDNGFM